MTQSCWDELGIEESTDARAIRKAYARRLKAIDADNDPAAFSQLRGALEQALLWAQWRQEDRAMAEVHQHEVASEPEPAADGFSQSPWALSEADAEQPAAPQACLDPAALEELDRLLFGGSPEQQLDPALLTAAVRRILNDPAMQSIDYAEWVERWLADTVAHSIPRSDPIVSIVAEHFAWARDESRWDLGPSIHYVTERHKGLALLERVANDKHRWHRAYLSLISTEGKFSREDWRERGNVLALLQFIRTKAPEAEGGLDPYRVALWEDGLYGPREEGYKAVDGPDLRWNPWFWIIWLILYASAAAFLWGSR